jgi:hypothetical protein
MSCIISVQLSTIFHFRSLLLVNNMHSDLSTTFNISVAAFYNVHCTLLSATTRTNTIFRDEVKNTFPVIHSAVCLNSKANFKFSVALAAMSCRANPGVSSMHPGSCGVVGVGVMHLRHNSPSRRSASRCNIPK